MKSRAMVLKSFNKPLIMEEFNIPPLKEGQVLVRINAAGVCGSDVHMWKGEDPRTPLPIILGHEGIGTISEIKGERECVSGEKLKPGDLVLWNRGITCGGCFACKVLNEPSLCQNRKVYGISRSCNTEPYLNGCYSEYVVLTEDTDIFVVKEKIDPAIMVSASCSGATVAHAFDMVHMSVGDTVLIQGPGPLGVYAVAFAKRLGASQIIVIGGSPGRLELCKEFGATTVINRKRTTIEERRQIVMDATRGRGVDLVIEAAGVKGVVEEGIKFLRAGGTYLSTGYAQPAGLESINFYTDVVRKNVNIQGVWVSDTRHTHQAMHLVMDNKDLFGRMITHRLPLNKANEALSLMNTKEALKAVLLPG